jgi:hypothetical protein
MPRGEETQEVPQEGREIKQEGQEANLEAERTQEVVEQPQAVVERERPVEESEEIEKEVVEAVEAADSSAARSEDEVSATPITLPDPPKDQGDEVSATPITLPDPPSDELSATPINTPGGSGEVSATPITLPDPPSDELSATPINTPGGSDEVSATPITLPDPPSDELSATPINTPRGGDEVSATPINTPGGADQVDLSSDDVKIKDGGLETEDGKQTPTRPILEKELPEGGQMEKGMDQQEDLQDLMDKDLDSLMPGDGRLTGPDGKKAQGSKYGDGVRGLPGMDSGGKIDGSAEDPSGDQFAGKGRFKPGKGPGGGDMESDVPGAKDSSTWTANEIKAHIWVKSGVSEGKIAKYEKSLQDKALDGYDLQKAITTGKAPDPPKPKKGKQKSSPDGEEGGSDVKAVSKEEFDAVIDKVDGSQISTKDPDGQGEGLPDRLTAEGAKKVKEAMDMAASSKHKQKKAGSEVVTDPDSEQEDKGGGKLGKKLGQ